MHTGAKTSNSSTINKQQALLPYRWFSFQSPLTLSFKALVLSCFYPRFPSPRHPSPSPSPPSPPVTLKSAYTSTQTIQSVTAVGKRVRQRSPQASSPPLALSCRVRCGAVTLYLTFSGTSDKRQDLVDVGYPSRGFLPRNHPKLHEFSGNQRTSGWYRC